MSPTETIAKLSQDGNTLAVFTEMRRLLHEDIAKYGPDIGRCWVVGVTAWEMIRSAERTLAFNSGLDYGECSFPNRPRFMGVHIYVAKHMTGNPAHDGAITIHHLTIDEVEREAELWKRVDVLMEHHNRAMGPIMQEIMALRGKRLRFNGGQ